MGLIAFVLVCWAIGKWLIEVSGEATTRIISAAKGNPPPTVKAKRGGFGRYVAESWRGWWEREEAALAAARAANPPTATARVRWRDRWNAAAQRFQQRPEVADRPEPETPPVPPPAPPAAEDLPVIRRPSPRPRPSEPATPPTPDAWNAPTPDVGAETVQPEADHKPQHAAPEPAQGGATMTAPTGEVVNYETHVAELQSEIAQQRQHVDSAKAALDAITVAKARVDEMQKTCQGASEAQQNKLDHLQGLHLDGTTLGHAATAVDALPPNKVDQFYEQAEAMEAEAAARHKAAADALAALEAELAHVQATHADHAAHVAGQLGGDARYLDSGGGTTVTTSDRQAVAA